MHNLRMLSLENTLCSDPILGQTLFGLFQSLKVHFQVVNLQKGDSLTLDYLFSSCLC